MRLSVLIMICVITAFRLNAQDQASFEIPKQTELSIPASPAFQLLDASSSLVSQPGAIRDFKVDWSFKTYRLAPNLSIEAQPIYSIFYNRPKMDRYRNAGWFLQMLSTLSVSAGSLDLNDSIRLFAYAGKITVYRQYDPISSTAGFEDLVNEYESQKSNIDSRIAELKQQLAKATGRLEKDSLEFLLFQTRDQSDQVNSSQVQHMHQRQAEIKSRFWNATSIDVAAGKSLSFNRFFSERIDSVKLENRSIAYWVNAGIGIGRRWLLTTLIRSEAIKIDLPDSGKTTLFDINIDPFTGDTTATPRDSLFVNVSRVTKHILSVGLNIRYGSPRYNFFIEAFYTKDVVPAFKDAHWEAFSDYGSNGRKKTAEIREQFLIAIGGEWRISNQVVLNYGIRSIVDKEFKMRKIFPLASITCLMR